MICNASETNSCGEGGVCVSAAANFSSCFCSEGYIFNDGGLCEVPRMPMDYSAVASFCWLCFLLVLGKFLRLYIWLFQKLYLPASVIGGTIGLVVLQVARLDQNVFKFMAVNFTRGWYNLAGFLINIVFSSLFLGTQIPKVKVIWTQAGPQLMYGMIIAWGQWIVALVVTGALLVRVHLGKPNYIYACFWCQSIICNYSTCGVCRRSWDCRRTHTNIQDRFPNGGDFGLASATLGLVFSVICGVMWVNIATHRGWVKQERIDASKEVKISIRGVYTVGSRPSAGVQTVRASSIDVLAFHLAVLGIAILIGYGLKQGLIAIESTSQKLKDLNFLSGIPLFPLCMAGGIIIQLVIERIQKINELIDASLMERIASSSLDFLVTSAIAKVDVSAIAVDIAPLLILCTCGFIWNFVMLGCVSRFLLPNHWFERAIADFGMNTGVIATGLILLRMVDPECRTPVPADFAFKQLLHSPFMGGGIWTCLALPLLSILNFYFRKHYTETCGCGLCAEEKPMSHSNQVGYGSLQGGGSQEMNGVHVEKEEESK
ncbi:uncharacterized protein LOC111334440 isoform X3 [Stylophora pistillata]|uniref:uncharacterized protein LOC111334440 isoform X3 n=1 Tax=Stylophora pistillata TaxID=50429 RepID=UPI000C03EE5D|nr:uncharacterized protein LOC111334440 isoform X3 [Stylophora pistillata]